MKPYAGFRTRVSELSGIYSKLHKGIKRIGNYGYSVDTFNTWKAFYTFSILPTIV
jgi:hypothetical protein